MIVLMAGLPGSGKSTLARELAARTSGRVLSKDEMRHAIFLPDEIEYSMRQDDYCLQLMLQTAGYLLAGNSRRSIFLDGRPFSRRYQIENVIVAAALLRQPWCILECVCSEETARRRLAADAKSGVHVAGIEREGRREIPSTSLRAGFSLRLSCNSAKMIPDHKGLAFRSGLLLVFCRASNLPIQS